MDSRDCCQFLEHLGKYLMMLTSIACRFMNESLTSISWYSGPTGLPDEVD